MDEPTTHLDISSIDALVDALKQFEGTLVFISHDVHFIKALANKVVHVASGKLTPYLGDYEFYLHKTASTSARAALTAGGERASRSGKNKKTKADKGKQRPLSPRAALRRQQKMVDKLEQQVDELESRQAQIQRDMELPEVFSDVTRATELQREMEANAQRLRELTAEWEREAARLEELAV